MLSSVYRVVVSVRTAIWLLILLTICMVCGAVLMPLRPVTYGGINSELLFSWLVRSGGGLDNLWFWAALVLLGLLALQTVICSLDAIIGLTRRAGSPLRIAPHFMHLGFLLILLGHLLSAGWGFRAGGLLPRGAQATLPDGSTLQLHSTDMQTYPSGFPRSWSADVSLFQGGRELARGRLGANRPLFYDGVGVYLKSLAMSRRGPAAEIMVNRDPGALWVLVGAVVFTMGNLFLLVLKIRRETPVTMEQ